MNLDRLEQLARAATQRDSLEPNPMRQVEMMNHNRFRMNAAANPQVLLALVAVVKAAQEMRVDPYGCRFCDSGKLRKPNDPKKGHDDNCPFMSFDAALAALNEAMGGE